MPELPEVETTVRGLRQLTGLAITRVEVRNGRLRQPCDIEAMHSLVGVGWGEISRRAKYILMEMDDGRCLLAHLGMSGSFALCDPGEPLRKHDHLIFGLSDGRELRYHDPRRFGFIEVYAGRSAALDSRWLSRLGPEPLEPGFDAVYLKKKAAGRASAVKMFIMDQQVVVGVGNIYANEALFACGVNPRKPACKLSRQQWERLAESIREILGQSITQGGTTLRDYRGIEGKLGYFRQTLRVYGREGQPCVDCGATIIKDVIGQRSTFWCPRCQK